MFSNIRCRERKLNEAEERMENCQRGENGPFKASGKRMQHTSGEPGQITDSSLEPSGRKAKRGKIWWVKHVEVNF